MRRTPRSRPLARPLVSIATSAAIALACVLTFAPTGCASKTEATPAGVTCKPGNYVFCRCQDREEGSKVCNEDGKSYGLCEPCETFDNPGIPDEPGVPPTPVDAGARDAQGPARCGDAIVQDGEDCDDGNKVDDDGCDSKCELAGADALATRSCPGLDTHVWSDPVTYTGTTAGAPLGAELTAPCTTSTRGAVGPDRIFKVTAHKTGTMTVSATNTSYDALLYVTDKCVQSPAQIVHSKCANDKNGIGNETMLFPVQSGSTYSVVVDGAGVSQVQGAFKLTLSIQ